MKNCEVDHYYHGRDMQKLVHVAHILLQKFRIYTPINIEDLPHLKNTLERPEKGENHDLGRLPLIGGVRRLGID